MSTHYVAINGKTHKVVIPASGPVMMDGRAVPAEVRLLAPGVLSILLTLSDGRTRSFRCIHVPDADEPSVLIDNRRIAYALTDPRSLRAASAGSAATGPRPLKAPMPGRIVRILVGNGEQVQAGQGCVVIEAMKMQNELKAPRAGTVARLTAGVGETMPAGATLLIVE